MDDEDLELAQRHASIFTRKNGVPAHERDDYVQVALLTIIEHRDRFNPDLGVPRQAFLGQRIQWRLIDLQRRLIYARETSLDSWIDRDAGDRFDGNGDDHASLLAIEDEYEFEDADALMRFLDWLRVRHPHRCAILETYLEVGSQKETAKRWGLVDGTIATTLATTYKIARAYGERLEAETV